MFVKDGIVYGENITPELKVESVDLLDDLCMLVTFSTGETRLFDATTLLDFPAFAPLKDATVFNSAKIDHGILTWDDGAIDIAPMTLYEKSYAYENNEIIFA